LTSMFSVRGVAGRTVAGRAASGCAVGFAGSAFLALVAGSAGGGGGGVVCALAAALAKPNIAMAINRVKGGVFWLMHCMG